MATALKPCIGYIIYGVVHRFANRQLSEHIRQRVLEWSQQYNTVIRVEIVGFSVYVEFPDETSLTLYCLTITDVDHSFIRVDAIPE
jgi:hypothetical protein